MGSCQPGGSPPAQIVVTGIGVTSAFGRGAEPLLEGVSAGRAAFAPVTRFDTQRCRAGAAAELPGEPKLTVELSAVIEQACRQAGLDLAGRAETDLLLGLHTDLNAARDPASLDVIGGVPAEVTAATGLQRTARVYTTACVAGSTAIIDAAVLIRAGQADRVVVAAGYLVDADGFWLFDAGRTLAIDGQVRPFSAGRKGMLLGDGVAAVVVESAAAAQARGATALARVLSWGRAGDGYHVCQPRPDGTGLARAITIALARAGIGCSEVGYINANATGTSYADASEAAAIQLAFGAEASEVPVSSTKSVHGHALEASALLEFVVTILALRAGRLPVNAGFLEPDPDCQLDLILGASRSLHPRHALSLNAAFGGANTALLLEAV